MLRVQSVTVPSNAETETLDEAAIERLGRQRPAVFRTTRSEVGFVSAIILSTMMAEYFVSGFNIVLPSLSEALDIAQSQRTWPAEVTSLSTAALLLVFARLGDKYGGRIVFLFGLLWLAVWSLVAGFSQNSTVLIVCRALQGIGSSAFLPTGIMLFGHVYRPGPRKNVVYSCYGAMAAIGFFVGILIGGVASQLLDWRWYFWIGAILAFSGAVLGFLTIPKQFDACNTSIMMDWLGLITITPGIVLIVYAFTDGSNAPNGWKTPYIIVTLVLGVLFLCAAVYVEAWVATQPLLPSELFIPKGIKRLVVAMFCFYGTCGIFLFYVSLYLETVLELSPVLTAVWYSPLIIGGLCITGLSGALLHRLPGRALLIFAGFGSVLSSLLFAILPAQDTSGKPSLTFLFWAYVSSGMVGGTIGIDITYNVTTIFITTAVPTHLQASAGALISCLVYLGISFWLGVAETAVSTYENHLGSSEDVTLRTQYQVAFWLAVGIAGVATILSSTIKIGQASSDMTADEKAQLASCRRLANTEN